MSEMNDLIQIDKLSFYSCALSSEEHIRESLGESLELPIAIAECLGSKEEEINLLSLFRLMKGCEYERVVRDNTYNHETDLSEFFIYSVYAPVGSSDWMWQRDCFVTIEMGTPGDPRYVGYATSEVYDLGDRMLGESGFFEWMLGWYAREFDSDALYTRDSALEEVNNQISAGYSMNPTYELEQLCYAEPTWVDKHEGYVARPKAYPKPLIFNPVPPCYN